MPDNPLRKNAQTPRANASGTPTLKLRARVMAGDAIAIGPGKIDLLEAIDATKSISAAAKSMGMSYRRAWLLVDEINHALSTPAVVTVTGGARGGGSDLTATGHRVVTLYRRIEQHAMKACQADIGELVALVRST